MVFVTEDFIQFISPGGIGAEIPVYLVVDAGEVAVADDACCLDQIGFSPELDGVVHTEIGGDGGVDVGQEIIEKCACPSGSLCSEECFVLDGGGGEGGNADEHCGI